MITQRRAEARDLDAILTIVRHAQAAIRKLGIDQWQDGYPEPEVIRSDIDAGIGHVFEVDGRIAGYLALASGSESVYEHIDGAWLSGGPYLTVHRMCIDDGYRGTGLSVEMFGFAQDSARERKLSSVRADTHRGNAAMRGLLGKCGFSYCGEVFYPVTAGDPIRVAYEKRIS